ncbi:MAG: hypothetical protein DI566_11785 [Microbacterium sp.]|nr:MAG: hypothetical protein DI566_11785 [Microbacterium sp.]
MHHLTRDEARRIAVRAQLLDADRPGDVVEVAEQIGSIKIDPTATIAPAEQAIPWSRIGWSYEPGQLKKAVEDDRLIFEHAGQFRPASHLPLMAARLRARELRPATVEYLEANRDFRADIVARLRAEGPLQASDIPDTSVVRRSNEGGWYSSNEVPRMLELLEAIGEVAIVARTGPSGRQRVWDLTERAWPKDLPVYDADEAEELLQARRLQALGIARRKVNWSNVGDAGDAASVEGSAWKWRVDPDAIAALSDDPGGRVAIMNPYDRMLFDRPRLKELFDFDYTVEQFKPKNQRIYGYFTYPILVGDRFVGQLDAALDKKKENLVVTAVHEMTDLDPEEREMVDAEIDDLAQWLGVPVVRAR